MVSKRFPLRKYLRWIADMESDFRWWETQYRDDSTHQWGLQAAARYEERAYILEVGRQKLHELFHELEAMPRLS